VKEEEADHDDDDNDTKSLCALKWRRGNPLKACRFPLLIAFSNQELETCFSHHFSELIGRPAHYLRRDHGGGIRVGWLISTIIFHLSILHSSCMGLPQPNRAALRMQRHLYAHSSSPIMHI
jgi:hypothetical protein